MFEQSSCVVCLSRAEQSRTEQSSVFEQREPRNADFVHTARCQFALSQAAVLCSGLALFGGNASFTTMAELALDFAPTHKRTHYLW